MEGDYHVFLDGDCIPVETCKTFDEAKRIADLHGGVYSGDGLHVMICREGPNQTLQICQPDGRLLDLAFGVDEDGDIETTNLNDDPNDDLSVDMDEAIKTFEAITLDDDDEDDL